MNTNVQPTQEITNPADCLDFHLSDGTVWVEQDPRPWLPARTYLVFDSSGAVLARVAIPRPLKVYQVGQDFVLGRWREEGEADQVRLYRIAKQTPAQ